MFGGAIGWVKDKPQKGKEFVKDKATAGKEWGAGKAHGIKDRLTGGGEDETAEDEPGEARAARRARTSQASPKAFRPR